MPPVSVVTKAELEQIKAASYVVYAGGRGSGKDWRFYDYLGWRTQKARRPLSIVICRAYRETVRDTAQKAIQARFVDWGLKGWYWGRDKFVHKKGHTIIFRGTERNIGTIRGLERVDILFLNEAQYVSDAGWREIPETVFRNRGQIFITLNPLNERGVIEREFIGPAVIPGKESPHPDTMLKVINYPDNPFWTPEMESNRLYTLETYGQEMHDHIYLGQYDISALANPFGRANILKARKQAVAGAPRYTAVDLAYSQRQGADYTVAIQADANGNLLRFIRGKFGGYQEQIAAITAFAQGTTIIVDATGTGHGIAEMLGDTGLPVQDVIWTPALKRAMIGSLTGMLAAERISIPPDAEWDWLQEELLYYEQVKTATGLFTDRYQAARGYYDDGVSALIMYAHRLWEPYQEPQVLTIDGRDDMDAMDGFDSDVDAMDTF